ncbi:unnamed protein product [Scytosiphon promiscuus]
MSGFDGNEGHPEEKTAGDRGEDMDQDQAAAGTGQARGDEDGDFIEAGDIAAEFAVSDAGAPARFAGAGTDDDAEVEDMAGATFEGHSDAVYCVAVNPKNHSQFVSGGGDDKGYLWAVKEDGSVAGSCELGGHTDTVSTVGFSADGSLVATGCYGGLLKVWEASTGALKHVLEGPEDVECLTWHTLGNVVLTGSQDGTVWMWEATAGTCMQVFAGHESKVSCVMFTSSGKAIVTGSDDGTVRVWAPRTGECRHVFSGHGFHEGAVTCLARHPDPAQAAIVMSGGEDGAARVMHIQNKRVLGTMVHCDAGAGSVEAVGFCASHPWVATGGTDGGLKVWDSVSGTCRHTCMHPAAVTRLEWHPAAPVVFTACVDGNVRAWDARTGVCTSLFTGHTDMILDMRLVDLGLPPPQSGGPVGGDAFPPVLVVTASDDNSSKLFRWPSPDAENAAASPAPAPATSSA